MNKALLYSTIAVAIAVVLTLTPLLLNLGASVESPSIGVRFTNTEDSNKLDQHGGSVMDFQESSRSVDILAVSFFLAVGVYMVFKRRTPRKYYRSPPYWF